MPGSCHDEGREGHQGQVPPGCGASQDGPSCPLSPSRRYSPSQRDPHFPWILDILSRIPGLLIEQDEGSALAIELEPGFCFAQSPLAVN